MAFGEPEQLVRIAQHDALASALDQALLLPCAENSAHGVQGGAGHLGDVLPADRKIDLDAMLDLAAGLLGQTQQRVRDTLLDLFAGHFEDAGLGVLQPAADGLQCACRQRRKFRDQFGPQPSMATTSATLSTTAIAVAG